MPRSTIGKMTLASALVIVLSFSCQLVDAGNVSFPVDIAMILMPAEDGWLRIFFMHAIWRITEHFEFSEDEAKLALVVACVEEDKTNWVLHPLSADTESVEKKLQDWEKLYLNNPVRNYGAAFRALPTVFTNSGYRAKAVIVIITTPPTSDDVKEMVTMSQQLRDYGGNIYVIVNDSDTFGRWVAENITGGTDRVIVDSKRHFPLGVSRMMPEVLKVMDKDLASRPTMPPTPSPPPAGKETTTSRGGLTKPTAPLQWASRLLIGLAVGHSRFMI